jgi:hypothetical protein
MSFGAPPFGDDSDANDRREDGMADAAPAGLVGRLRRHIRTWPGRYVEMRTETGR